MTGGDGIPPPPADAGRPSRRVLRIHRVPWRAEARHALELVALSAFAFTSPVLEVFGDLPSWFVLRDASRADIVWFGLLVLVLPPAILTTAAVFVAVLAGRAVRRVLQLLLVSALSTLIALQVAQSLLGARGVVLVVLGLTVAALAVVAYARWRPARLWLAYASPAGILFLAVFLFTSPVSALVLEAPPGPLDEVDTDLTVVVLVLDELPVTSLLDADAAIDAERFPALAALADQATWYRNATTVAEYTFQAVPALLTGRYPFDEPAASATDHPENLFTLLARSHELYVDEGVTSLCPQGWCSSYASATASGLGQLLGDAGEVWRSRVSPWADHEELADTALAELALGALVDVPAGLTDLPSSSQLRFESFLEDVEPTDRPSLYFSHLVLPHYPWQFFPDGTRYEPLDIGQWPGQEGSRWAADPWPALHAQQRHLLQLQFADAMVGRLLERIDALDALDDALVIVTADHGVSFEPGELRRGFEPDNLADTAWVPLLVRYPGQTEAVVDDRNVELVDLLPTIADVGRFELPFAVDGVSLAGDPLRDDEKTLLRYRSLLQPNASDVLTVDATEHFEQVLRSGPPPAPPGFDDRGLGILATGPHGELLGRAVTTVPRVDRSDRTLRVDDLEARLTVDVSRPQPASVTGVLSGDGRGVVALALDGVIAAVAPTFAAGGGTQRLLTLLAPGTLAPGANDLDAYLVVTDQPDEGGERVALAPLDLGR